MLWHLKGTNLRPTASALVSPFPFQLFSSPILCDGEGEEGKESGNQGKVLTPERCLISSSPSTPDTDRNQATPGSALHSFLSPHYFLLLASDGEEEERKLKPIKRKCGGEGRYEGYKWIPDHSLPRMKPSERSVMDQRLKSRSEGFILWMAVFRLRK